MQDAKIEVCLTGEQDTRGVGFSFPFGDEVDILPSSEEVEVVPERTTVAQKYEIWHVCSVVTELTAQISPGLLAPYSLGILALM